MYCIKQRVKVLDPIQERLQFKRLPTFNIIKLRYFSDGIFHFTVIISRQELRV